MPSVFKFLFLLLVLAGSSSCSKNEDNSPKSTNTDAVRYSLNKQELLERVEKLELILQKKDRLIGLKNMRIKALEKRQCPE